METGPAGRKVRYYAELKTKGGCISSGEAAAVLSGMCGSRMVARAEGKTLINRGFAIMGFAEEVNFKMLYGAVKITKEKETISGDNYTCATEENGQFSCVFLTVWVPGLRRAGRVRVLWILWSSW
mgnify:CR=1 FL=1